MVEEARVIQSVTVQRCDQEVEFEVGEELGGRVVIEIVDKSTPSNPRFDLLDEEGDTIFTIENLPCSIEWKTIAIDGPVGEVSNG